MLTLLPLLLLQFFLAAAQEGQSIAPISPAPALPATIILTSAPISAVPITAAPITGAPITGAPITKAPVSNSPVSNAPVTKAPVSNAPVSKAPVSKAPVSNAPVTKAPVTKAPVSNAPVTNAPVTSAPMSNPIVAKQDFDEGGINVVSGFDPAVENLDGGSNDWFGIGSIGSWPQSGIPVALVDDSVVSISGGSINTGDDEGIFGQNKDPNDNFFGMSDLREFGNSVTASWTFNIAGFSDLSLSIDMGGVSSVVFGGYNPDTEIKFTVQLDGSPVQTAFTVTDAENDGSFATRLMDDGGSSGGGRLLVVDGDNEVTKTSVDGSVADNLFFDKTPADGPNQGKLDTFSTSISQEESSCFLTLTLIANLPFEAMAFDNIVIRGQEFVQLQVLAKQDFDGGAVNVLNGFDPAVENQDGGPSDWFGIGNLESWPQSSGVPFGLVDNSGSNIGGRGFSAGDSEGVFGQNKDTNDNFFAMSDLREFGESATASWTFNVDKFSNLLLSIDMGGISNIVFGGYNADTEIKFTFQVEDGPIQTAFIITAVENDGSFVTRPMDDGGESGGGRLLVVDGDNEVVKTLVDGSTSDNHFLDKTPADGPNQGKMDTFSTRIGQTSNALSLTVNLTANLPYEAMAFDNIVISGTPSNCGISELTIMEIQGESHMSPFLGQRVTTSGIVTAISSGGFYLQDQDGDGNIATSDAVFIHVGSRVSDVSVADMVQVTGTVHEFDGREGDLSRTELRVGEYTIMSNANSLPAPVIIGEGGRIPPSEIIDAEPSVIDPVNNGLDFFASMESMFVTVEDVVAVSATTKFGEIFTVANRGANATGISTRGTLNISPNDFNPEKIQIDKDASILDFDFPSVNVGALLGDITGIMSYSFSYFEVIPTQDFSPSVTPSSIEPEVTSLTGSVNQLIVASYNVLNLDPNDNDGDTDVSLGRFELIASQVVNNLLNPDIIGLQEVQDNSGRDDNGDFAADVTLQKLVNAIINAGGPRYEYVDNTFITDDSSGGQPHGNIRCAFLYNPRRVTLVPESVRPVSGQGDGEAFQNSRLPLAADFDFNSGSITVITSHFSSKSGSASMLGTDQPFDARQEDPDVNGGLENRQAQSAAIQEFVQDIFQNDNDANVVVLGDFNEYEFISPITDMESAGLVNLMNTLPENERYTFIHQGNSQSLDHMLVSQNMTEGASFDIVHLNAEFAEFPSRASDHDPIVASLTIGIPFVICFSSDATAQVYNKGTVAMKDLVLGDLVMVAGGKFSEVYSFGHRDDNLPTKFLSIDSGLKKPLLISADHLVFVKGSAVPASSVLIGDELSLVDGSAVTVKTISVVTSAGAFAPFTKDGTIVVDNIVASSYVSLQSNSAKLTIGGIDTMNWHDLAHISQAPHRVICRVSPNFCASSEIYNDLGISIWVDRPLTFVKWAIDKKPFVTIMLLLPVLALLLVVAVAETIFSQPALLCAIIFGALCIFVRPTAKKNFFRC